MGRLRDGAPCIEHRYPGRIHATGLRSGCAWLWSITLSTVNMGFRVLERYLIEVAVLFK
jgi:hypothetical protein